MIDISQLNKSEVLAALYNSSKPQGLGHLHYDATLMTKEEAETLLETWTYFDYLKGRVMKVDLSEDTLHPELYDRDNGEDAAELALHHLLQQKE